ncbi:hypothetical protein ACFSCZ_14385 [Siminovitchia sediminis]|uniref:Uncharacterized protein n=1 Tax=Siminovitchia sediminis TaxID=1274353 RepID=A0ABW4KIU6_9BACI
MGEPKNFIFYEHEDTYDSNANKCTCGSRNRDTCRCDVRKKDRDKCNYKKSRLFCTTSNEKVVIESETQFQLRLTLAELEVCNEGCSPVLHDICGVLHSLILPVDTPEPVTPAVNLQFRIIDEFGREVCQRHISFAFDITPPRDANGTDPLFINLPFCIKCCDLPRSCDPKTTYRLQVDSLDQPPELLTVVIRDATWTAIVWEDDEEK